MMWIKFEMNVKCVKKMRLLKCSMKSVWRYINSMQNNTPIKPNSILLVSLYWTNRTNTNNMPQHHKTCPNTHKKTNYYQKPTNASTCSITTAAKTQISQHRLVASQYSHVPTEQNWAMDTRQPKVTLALTFVKRRTGEWILEENTQEVFSRS